VIKSSLNKVEATKYYSDIVNIYNNFPTTSSKVNPDLAGFVTGKATDALFDLVAKKKKIYGRTLLQEQPKFLKKVFGGL
jgi:hypothetical protein